MGHQLCSWPGWTIVVKNDGCDEDNKNETTKEPTVFFKFRIDKR